MTSFAHTASVARETRQPREALTMNSRFSRSMSAFASYELTGEVSIDGGVRNEHALHRFLDRTVMIRRLMPTATGRAHRYYTFLQEIHAQAMLRHPSLAQVCDAGIYDEQPYAVIEQPRGTALDEQVAWLAEQGACMNSVEALRMVDRLADLVEHAHRHGVRVPNLIPANIVLADDGVPVLTSLGSPEVPEALRADEQRLAFSSPEMLGGALSDHRSDIYALGVLLYYALTGRSLFSGDAESVLAQKQSGHSPALADLPDDVDADALERVIRMATARRLAERYTSVREFRRDLAALLDAPQEQPVAVDASRLAEEPLLARELGAPAVTYEYRRPAARPTPSGQPRPAPAVAKEAPPAGPPIEDPTNIPGADREEFREALAFSILVPLPDEDLAETAAETAPAAAPAPAETAAAFAPAVRFSWLSVIVVVVIALGTALVLG